MCYMKTVDEEEENNAMNRKCKNVTTMTNSSGGCFSILNAHRTISFNAMGVINHRHPLNVEIVIGKTVTLHLANKVSFQGNLPTVKIATNRRAVRIDTYQIYALSIRCARNALTKKKSMNIASARFANTSSEYSVDQIRETTFVNGYFRKKTKEPKSSAIISKGMIVIPSSVTCMKTPSYPRSL